MNCLFLAANCHLPERDGGGRRSWQLFNAITNQGLDARFVGYDSTVIGGVKTPHAASRPWRQSKSALALAAFLTGRDYWQVKMLHPGVRAAVREAGREAVDTVMIHYLYTLPLLGEITQSSARLIVDTHNYDPELYRGFRDAARNPLVRLLCNRAMRTSRLALARLPPGTIMTHVNDADAAAWRQDRPDLVHTVVGNGTNILPRKTVPAYSDLPKQLIFVGSLSSQMNQDALENFGHNFWPSLHSVARLRVVGSAPSSKVVSLCQANGWELRANVSDSDLERSYQDAHFAIMPFSYGAGSKLKLFEALGRGIPVLATNAGVAGVGGIEGIPGSVLVADSPADWRTRIESPMELMEVDRQRALEFAINNSWPMHGKKVLEVFDSARPVTLPRR